MFNINTQSIRIAENITENENEIIAILEERKLKVLNSGTINDKENVIKIINLELEMIKSDIARIRELEKLLFSLFKSLFYFNRVVICNKINFIWHSEHADELYNDFICFHECILSEDYKKAAEYWGEFMEGLMLIFNYEGHWIVKIPYYNESAVIRVLNGIEAHIKINFNN